VPPVGSMMAPAAAAAAAAPGYAPADVQRRQFQYAAGMLAHAPLPETRLGLAGGWQQAAGTLPQQQQQQEAGVRVSPEAQQVGWGGGGVLSVPGLQAAPQGVQHPAYASGQSCLQQLEAQGWGVGVMMPAVVQAGQQGGVGGAAAAVAGYDDDLEELLHLCGL
jgi:hypothetical protein